ncbi:MAG: hypothetical protein KF878_15660 [Planctomycetes bacterium]|nr:hypothetical protein [Planctomycetota bacterium]
MDPTELLPLLLFPLLWVAILVVIALVGGWSLLARDHRAVARPAEVQRFVSGRFGLLMNYNHCLVVAAADEGLFLGVLLPFRPGHPDLLVPWSEVRVLEERAGLVRPWTHLELGPSHVRVWLAGAVGVDAARRARR